VVEVVTREEFDKFKKFVEDRLGKMEEDTKKGQDNLLKAFGDLTANVDKIETAIRERVDEVEEKSKSFITRIKEAIEPVSG